MPENERWDSHLAILETAITLLFYISMVLGTAIISYGMFMSSNGSVLTSFVIGLISIAASYVVIIGMSTIAQEAYSNFYDDFYRPRRFKLARNQTGKEITVNASKIPEGTSLILATVDETNIADFHNSPREYRSGDQDFRIKKTSTGVKLTNGHYTEVFEEMGFSDLRLHLYRDSPQCRWIGDTIEVGES